VFVVHHGALHRQQRPQDEHLDLVEHVGGGFVPETVSLLIEESG
jgi:hypothetical protein